MRSQKFEPMNSTTRIIVVDDNNDHLHIIRLILEKFGYEVKTLQRSENVLETVKAYQPGLIFMDHHVPMFDGVLATKLLKSDAGCKHIPVVYFTSENNIEELAVEAGADDWLRKPFSLEDLIGKVVKLLPTVR